MTREGAIMSDEAAFLRAILANPPIFQPTQPALLRGRTC